MTCINKAAKGGCQLQNRFCRYPDCDRPTGLEPKVEMVNHPKHYNQHPSGVEAIELCRLLSFNVGNALKYVMRRDDKGSAKQDLQKAIWYLKDEVAHLSAGAIIAELTSAVVLADKIKAAEKNQHAQKFYEALADSLRYQMYSCPQKQHLETMIQTVEALLQTYP